MIRRENIAIAFALLLLACIWFNIAYTLGKIRGEEEADEVWQNTIHRALNSSNQPTEICDWSQIQVIWTNESDYARIDPQTKALQEIYHGTIPVPLQ